MSSDWEKAQERAMPPFVHDIVMTILACQEPDRGKILATIVATVLDLTSPNDAAADAVILEDFPHGIVRVLATSRKMPEYRALVSDVRRTLCPSKS